MWYRGTADAIWQNLDILEAEAPVYVLVLAGDHIYRQDYSLMLEDHVTSGADVTVGCVEVAREEATAFGVMAIDESRRVTAFVEKPADPPAMPGKPDKALASMGIYVFSLSYLTEVLNENAKRPNTQHDFGKDIIPPLVENADVLAHSLQDSAIYSPGQTKAYWRDVGTIDAFWEANLDLTTVTPELDLYDESWPIFTLQSQVAPAKFIFDEDRRRGFAVDSLVSGGVIVSGGTVRRSLLSTQVRVNSYCDLNGAVILPGTNIGRRTRLTNVVVDTGCNLPEDLVIGEDPEADARRFLRTEAGVTLVTRSMLEANNLI